MSKECLFAGAFRSHGAQGGFAAEVFPSGSPVGNCLENEAPTRMRVGVSKNQDCVVDSESVRFCSPAAFCARNASASSFLTGAILP